LAARIALSGRFDNGKLRTGSPAVGQKQPADCAETVNAPICLHQGAPPPPLSLVANLTTRLSCWRGWRPEPGDQRLYSFCAEASCTDGANPGSSLIAHANGDLFGTTSQGRGVPGCSRHGV
jgi:hypothetical protein